MAAMTMKEMQQRARQQQKVGQESANVAPVLAQQIERGDEQSGRGDKERCPLHVSIDSANRASSD